MPLTSDQRAFVEGNRVAHLATADALGTPHILPVCFVLAADTVYIALDAKPKRVEPLKLKRARNIVDNPSVSLLADRYDEDWARLGWVRLDGRAELLVQGSEHTEALRSLHERYPQYESLLPAEAPVISVRVEQVSSWGDLSVRS